MSSTGTKKRNEKGRNERMQQHAFANEHEEQAQAPSKQNENQKRRWETRLQYFVNWEPEKQLQAFFTWLPKELHDAPGIDWPALPREIMGYSLRAIGNSPDVVTLALAAGVLAGAVSVVSHLTMFKHLNLFFRDLRITCHIQSPADLKDAQIWHEWASHQEGKEGRRQWVDSYASFTTGHFPLYLLRLDQAGRLRMQQYALPSLPPGLREKYFPMKQIRKVQQAKRKEQTDILVPLYPVLRQLIRFRKQLAERTVLAIREACRKVEEGSVHLPFRFELTSTIPEVNRNAQTIAEIQIYGREVCLPFILWDKRAWVEHHPDLYSNEIVRVADESQKYYDQEHNCFFVQFDGPTSDCLWFGDLVEHRLFQRFEKAGVHLEGYQERWQLARQLGFSAGCHCGRPGLLASRDRWFSIAADRSKALIFEPESLYRGVLFGSALAMIALSNGSRVNELLQVSWNKERRITRQESVVLLGEDGQPLLGDDDQPLTRQVKLYFQHLLPKGAKTDEERQLFPLTRECMRLLGEIKALLEETVIHHIIEATDLFDRKRRNFAPFGFKCLNSLFQTLHGCLLLGSGISTQMSIAVSGDCLLSHRSSPPSSGDSGNASAKGR